MGDSCCDPDTMGRVAGLIQNALPGVFVHSIQVGDDPENDANAGFFGNINKQVSWSIGLSLMFDGRQHYIL